MADGARVLVEDRPQARARSLRCDESSLAVLELGLLLGRQARKWIPESGRVGKGGKDCCREYKAPRPFAHNAILLSIDLAGLDSYRFPIDGRAYLAAFMHAWPTIQAAMKRTRAAQEWTRRFGKIIYAGARLALLVIETVVLFS